MNLLCFFGFHHYEPRYDNQAQPALLVTNSAMYTASEGSTTVFHCVAAKYLGEVCSRCGDEMPQMLTTPYYSMSVKSEK